MVATSSDAQSPTLVFDGVVFAGSEAYFGAAVADLCSISEAPKGCTAVSFTGATTFDDNNATFAGAGVFFTVRACAVRVARLWLEADVPLTCSCESAL